MKLVSIGVLLGLFASLLLTRLMTRLLFGVSATDPLTFGVVGALFAPVLAAVGALAALASNFTLEVVRKDDEAK